MRPQERATFDAAELAVALSYYDLGVIESITEFPRGSRRSPKVGIVCERGKFVLKRRAADRAKPDRLRSTHRVMRHLVEAGFPAPKLVATRDRKLGYLQIRDHVYELFEFVPGHPYQRTPNEAFQAGAVLAQFHQKTVGFDGGSNFALLSGSYHDAAGVRTGLCAISSTLSSHDSFTGDEAELATLIQLLLSAYDTAAEGVNRAGIASWPEQIVHSDWHPGNLLFRNGKVVAVIDYDGLRCFRHVADVANGALQFSMVAAGDPAAWPDPLDEGRFRAFLGGYESVGSLPSPHRICLPPLMIEALIAECVAPIAATGSVGRWAGYRVLQMVRRKVTWINSNADSLSRVWGG